MKKGQFFTLDAFVALLVVATGIMLVLAVHTYRPTQEQPQILTQEFVNALAETKIRQINNPFLVQQIRGGNITNTENTILQQAYEFKEYKSIEMSSQLVSNVTPSLIPKQFNYEIIVDGDVLITRGTGQDSTDLLISSKKIVFGTKDKLEEFWGPIVVEVRVWQ